MTNKKEFLTICEEFIKNIQELRKKNKIPSNSGVAGVFTFGNTQKKNESQSRQFSITNMTMNHSAAMNLRLTALLYKHNKSIAESLGLESEKDEEVD